MTYGGHPDQSYRQITYSQHGEDLMIVGLFDQLGIKTPSYLDLGAHHPVHISNTKLLYDRGSRGVNVEANPNLIREFIFQRPHDVNVNYGVGLMTSEATFYMYDNWSGRNTFSKTELARVTEDYGMKLQSTQLIPILRLDEIVDRYCNGLFPEFLTSDIEGLDFDILQQAYFFSTRGKPKIICVEVRLKDTQSFCYMLRGKGFEPYCRMGENMIFVDKILTTQLQQGWYYLG